MKNERMKKDKITLVFSSVFFFLLFSPTEGHLSVLARQLTSSALGGD